jgi:hypothetical protein
LVGVGEAGCISGTIKAPYHSKKDLQQHLLKISRQKHDSRQMADVLLANRDWVVPHYAGDRSFDVFSLQVANSAAKLKGCGSWLMFGRHVKKSDVELVQAQFCQQTYLCLFCQARRAYRNISAYHEKLVQVQHLHPGCIFVMATFTIPNTADLLDGIRCQKDAFKKLWDRTKQWGTGPLAGAIGAVYSVEITEGNDTLWHPHIHCILVMSAASKGFIPYVELRNEWCALTGGRQIRIDKMKSFGDLTEALKYTVKPLQAGEDGLGLVKRMKVWALMSGKRVRMLQPYGCLKGVAEELPLNMPFDPAEYDLYLYRWMFGRYIPGEVDQAKFKSKGKCFA